MPARIPPEKFAVAFSLAGEQRDAVRPIAEALEAQLGSPNVFYDEWFEHYIAGPGTFSYHKLQEIYGPRSVLVVACISAAYGGKPWTTVEHDAILARYMKSLTSRDERDQLGILYLRVGDGDVSGIDLTAIIPDIRGRRPTDAAQLILDRLSLLLPPSVPESHTADWPAAIPELHWHPIADHTAARQAFAQLLTRESPFRLLPIKGASETGKTHITRQMLSNVLNMPNLACGRFDFKGVTKLDIEVSSFVQELATGQPPAGLRLNDNLGYIFEALRRRGRPAVLIFDTFEAAGEAREWIEKQLLPGLIRCPWLRVTIVGQDVPRRAGSVWESVSSPVIELTPPSVDDWFVFGQQYRPGKVTREFVGQLYEVTEGSAATLAAALGPRN
jgi:hypothetical protein